jgi:hypothetical protein
MIGHSHNIVAHVYESEQPSRPVAVISFDPDDSQRPGERVRRSEFLPRVGETISLWKGQRGSPSGVSTTASPRTGLTPSNTVSGTTMTKAALTSVTRSSST